MKASKSTDMLRFKKHKTEKGRNSINVSGDFRPLGGTMNELGNQIRKIIRTDRANNGGDISAT